LPTHTSHGGFIIYGPEQTYGVAVAPTATVPYPRTAGWTVNNQLFEIDSIGRAEPSNIVGGFADVRANFEAYLTGHDRDWFFFALGRAAANEVTGYGVATVQVSATNKAASITVHIGDEEGSNEDAAVVHGCRVDSLAMTTRVGEPVSYTVNMIGKSASIRAAATKPSAMNTINPFIYADGYVLGAAGGDSLATIANIEEFTLTVNNNLEQLPSINRSDGRRLHEVAQNQKRITGEMTVRFDNITYLRWALGNPASWITRSLATIALKLDFEQETALTATINWSMTASLPKCRIGEGGYQIGTNEILTYRLPFSAYLDVDNTALQFKFTSSNASFHRNGA
jgi:hypothetical protein